MKKMKKITLLILIQILVLGSCFFAEAGVMAEIDSLSPALLLKGQSFFECLSFIQRNETPRLFLEKRKQFYSVSNADFISGFYSGFWPVKNPIKDVLQSCTGIVFVDKNNQIFLSHIDADIEADWDMDIFVNEWQAYPATDAFGNLQPAFNMETLFTQETKVLILNRAKQSRFSISLRDYLSKKGIDRGNINIAELPKQRQTDTIGLFFWPKDGQLEVSYASLKNTNSYDVFQVSKYNLKDMSLAPMIFRTGEKVMVDIAKLKDKILYNKLIQKFSKLSQAYNPDRMPWSFILHECLELEEDFMVDVISEIEEKGEKWISDQAEIIRETHSSRSSYKNTDTGGSWQSFIEKTDTNSYNLSHLLAHSIAFVKDYIEIGNEIKAREFLKQGYIILRAIEIESARQDIKPSESLPKKADIQYNLIGQSI